MRAHRIQFIPTIAVAVLVPMISLCATFLLLYGFAAKNTTPVATTAKPLTTTEQTKVSTQPSLPTELAIESIHVAAAVNPTGLTPAGDMDIDENPKELAWYKLGPTPGEVGSAVIAGHYGWKNTTPAIFNELHKVVVGDEVQVLSKDGEKKAFVVTRTALYMPDQDATDVFTSNDGKAHLNIITCQGTWNDERQTYSERLIVFTDYVGPVK